MSLSPCAEIVERGDPDRYRTSLFAPPALRERLFALYAFNLEIAKIAPMVSEPMLGEIRLQWWREALDQIYGSGAVRAHEVTTPLAEAVREADLPRAPFDGLIDARACDLDPGFPADDAALFDYIEATAGGLSQLAALALAPLDEAGQGAARDAGFAIGASRYLLAQPAMVKAGCKPLTMERVDALAAEGRRRLNAACAARAAVPKAAAPALLEAVTAGYNLTAATPRSPRREKWSIIWNGLRNRW